MSLPFTLAELHSLAVDEIWDNIGKILTKAIEKPLAPPSDEALREWVDPHTDPERGHWEGDQFIPDSDKSTAPHYDPDDKSLIESMADIGYRLLRSEPFAGHPNGPLRRLTFLNPDQEEIVLKIYPDEPPAIPINPALTWQADPSPSTEEHL